MTAFSVRVQEAALTGESVPVDKDAGCLLNDNAPLGDRRNMVYIGTVTATGKASAEVLAQHNIALKTVPEVEHASDMRTLNIVCPNFDEQLACFQPVGKVPPPNDSVERASGTADP